MPDAEERLRTEMNSLWYRWVRARREMSKGWGNLYFEHRAGACLSQDPSPQELPWDQIDVAVVHSQPTTLFLPMYRASVRGAVLPGAPVRFDVTWDLVQECPGPGDGDMEYLHREAMQQLPVEELEHAIRRASDHVLHLLRSQLAHDEAWMHDRDAPAAT